MNVLVLDIETSPNVVYTWGLWDQNVGLNQIISTSEMICFAAKFLDDKQVHFASVFKEGKDDMLYHLWLLLDTADVVVHYNGTSFDIPHINREFLAYGYEPPSPYKQIDLFRVVKKQFKFQSSKLDFVSRSLDLPGKAQNEGFDLWKKCLDGDAKAWKQMEKYNRQDVKVTEALYLELLPWIPSHPSRTLYDGTNGCPTCGSDKIMRRGFAYTTVSKFQQYQCTMCGSYFRDSRKVTGVQTRSVVQ